MEVKEVKEKPERAGVVRTYSDLLVYKQAYRLALDVSKRLTWQQTSIVST